MSPILFFFTDIWEFRNRLGIVQRLVEITFVGAFVVGVEFSGFTGIYEMVDRLLVQRVRKIGFPKFS